MNAMTAAHRTLPLGSIVRVTNVKTGHAAVVRITDRGPFVPGRIVDLSLAAAKKTDVWQPGIARVRVEVLQTPTLLETSGRWAVQIGAFDQENAARTLAGRLSQRYRTAKVLCFNSPVGDWWVRVRVRGDEKKRAEELAHETQTPQGSIFLVRLDFYFHAVAHQIRLEMTSLVNRAFGLRAALFDDEHGLVRPFAVLEEF